MSVAALDIGTSNVKALLARWDGQIVAVDSRRTPTLVEAPGQLAFDAEAVGDAASSLLRTLAARHPDDAIEALVFACLGTAMVPLDRDGRSLGPALSPTDARPRSLPGLLDGVPLEPERVLQLTGMELALTSFLHHWLWWRRTQREGVTRLARFRSLRGYLLHQLCGADAEDVSWASRTMLLDIDRGAWSEEILDAVGLSAAVLPEATPATATWSVEPGVAPRFGLAPDARIVLGGMDNACSVLGAREPGTRRLVNIVGTYEHLAGSGELDEARRAAAAPFGVLHRDILPDRYVAMSRVPMGHLLELVAQAAPAGLEPLMSAVSSEPSGERMALDAEAVSDSLRAGVPPVVVLQGILEAAVGVLAESLGAWGTAGAAIDEVVAVGGGAVHDRPLRLKAEVLGRRISMLRWDEAAGVGALRLAAMAVRGASADEACRLFRNPIVRTWRPRGAGHLD